MNNWQSGHFAEKVARYFMLLKGYRMVAANYVTGRGTTAGEVDMILRRGKTIVFAEVKKRSSLDKAAYALQKPQQQRIRRAAANFIAKNPRFQNFDVRFDVLLVCLPYTVCHIKNAF